MKVMHDALAVNGIMVHQLPSTGWMGHGYFCYHAELFQDLAQANGYDVLDLWYIPTGECWFDSLDVDVRDPMRPEEPHSANHDPNRRFAPSHNLNIVLGKRVDRPFSLALELATSHAGISGNVGARYGLDRAEQTTEGNRSQGPSVETSVSAESSPEPDLSQHYRYVSGRALLRECARRIGRRLGVSASAGGGRERASREANSKPGSRESSQGTDESDRSKGNASKRGQTTSSFHRRFDAVEDIRRWMQFSPGLPSHRTLDGDVGSASLSAAHFYELGRAARDAGREDIAFGHFARSNSLIPRYPPTQDALKEMSAACLSSLDAFTEGPEQLWRLTRAIEMDPSYEEPRQRLAKLISKRQGPPDLTQMCFVFHDAERAKAVHMEAYTKAIEFITLGGIVGDVLEFGVLGGWSARLFAETMRDAFNLNNLHLFDSFEGLPEYASDVDRRSYEIAGRNLWADRMRFPSNFLAQFGEPHDRHIRDRVSEVIRKERIFIHKGFFADTLPRSGLLKAALVHFDCDLYQSTVEVLGHLLLGEAFQDGCVLVFDDWNCNRASPNYGQRRAFSEFLQRQERFSASFWYSYGFNGAVYILHQTGA